ncbi:MAG: substrate-binding domain-containing protein [Nostocoides sp.]
MGAALIAVTLAAFGVIVVKLYSGAQTTASPATLRTDNAACTKTAEVTVTVTPELQPIISAGAARAKAKGVCANYRIEASASKKAAAELDAKHTTVWIPDSSTWLDGLPLSTADDWIVGSNVAHSPIGLAGPSSLEDRLEMDSWAAALRGRTPMIMANPDNDTSSRLAFYDGIGDIGTVDVAVGARLIFLSRNARPDANAILTAVSTDPAKAAPFPLSEQQVFAWNRDHPDQPLSVHIPSKGTQVMDYPMITPRNLDAARQQAVETLANVLVSDIAVADFAAAGFRTFTDKGGPTLPGDAAAAYTVNKLPSAGQRQVAVEQWQVLRTDMRMLAVLDVSGSMGESSGASQQTRWGVLASAAGEALSSLPASSKVGTWVFSTNLIGAQPWAPMADIEALNAQDGVTTHRERLRALVDSAGSRLGGDTGLYVTTIEAFRSVKKSYDGKYINSVVILTDGVNDFPGSSYSLTNLLADLKAEFDPKKPVRIITIGMGDADPKALKKISAATGGTSYIAQTGDVIQQVLVEALLARPLPVTK